MDGLLEWHVGDSLGVQVWFDPARAGRSAMVIDESDLDALAARLSAAGLDHDGPQQVTASRVLVLTDPDGNQIVVPAPEVVETACGNASCRCRPDELDDPVRRRGTCWGRTQWPTPSAHDR